MAHSLVVVVGILVLGVVDKAGVVNDHTGAHAQSVVELSHPATVKLSQIVVDSDHVDTPTGQSIQIDRGGSN